MRVLKNRSLCFRSAPDVRIIFTTSVLGTLVAIGFSQGPIDQQQQQHCRSRGIAECVATRNVAAQPRVAYADPRTPTLDVGVFARPRSLTSARKSSRTAAFGALGNRSDVRDEISSTSDFDLPRSARNVRGCANSAGVRVWIYACVRACVQGCSLAPASDAYTWCSGNQEACPIAL